MADPASGDDPRRPSFGTEDLIAIAPTFRSSGLEPEGAHSSLLLRRPDSHSQQDNVAPQARGGTLADELVAAKHQGLGSSPGRSTQAHDILDAKHQGLGNDLEIAGSGEPGGVDPTPSTIFAETSYDPTAHPVLVSAQPIMATLVNEDRGQELVRAEKSNMSQNCYASSGKKWVWIGLAALLLIVAVVVGAVIGTTTRGTDKIVFNTTKEVFVEQMDPVLNGEPGSMYGSSLSMNTDGTRLAVGSVDFVQVFHLVNNSWVPLGPRILGPVNTSAMMEELAAVIRSASVVELSKDGTSLVVGWPLANSEGGEMVGMAEAFVYNDASGLDGEWEPLGQELVGNAAGDLFGAAVSLSERGDRVR